MWVEDINSLEGILQEYCPGTLCRRYGETDDQLKVRLLDQETSLVYPRKNVDEEPKNNHGLSVCYWCRQPTVKKDLVFYWDDYCQKCKK